MNTLLFDGPERIHFLPFTFTRPVAELRVGILTLREKWELFLGVKSATITQDYLTEKWPVRLEKENLMINPAYLPSEKLTAQIDRLKLGEQLIFEGAVIACKTRDIEQTEGLKRVKFEGEVLHVGHSYELIQKNAEALQRDFMLITKGRNSQPIPKSVRVRNTENVFIEEGAQLFDCSLNAEEGPIYIGKDAEVMEGAHVRGPFAMGAYSLIKMGAKIYGETTLGPHCKVGGEVAETIFLGYSNKAHDGFLGHSVLGEWCNIGADSNNSDLKNNYAPVRLWDYEAERFSSTGMQFCGLMMGDHSKCGINTMFNTGTVIGVSANIFGAGFPRNFIPSFSWGGAHKMMTYKLKKVFEVAEKVMARRDKNFDAIEQAILTRVFEDTQKYRRE